MCCKRVVLPDPRKPDKSVTGRALAGIGADFWAAAFFATMAVPLGFDEDFAFAMFSQIASVDSCENRVCEILGLQAYKSDSEIVRVLVVGTWMAMTVMVSQSARADL